MFRRYKPTRESYIPKDATLRADDQSDAVAYTYETNGVVYALGFSGKRNKPDFHHRYKSAERRDQHIGEHFAHRRAALQRRRAELDARKNYVHDLKPGDVLDTCWGYEQTNREFFQVVAVKGKMVTLREIAQKTVRTYVNGGKCAPLVDQFIGEPISRRAGPYGVKIDNVRRASRSKYVEVGPVRVYDAVSFSDGY